MALDFPYIKHTKAHFIEVFTLFSQNEMYTKIFQRGGCGHLGSLNFEALLAIFLAGHTAGLSSVPFNTPKKLVSTRFGFGVKIF